MNYPENAIVYLGELNWNEAIDLACELGLRIPNATEAYRLLEVFKMVSFDNTVPKIVTSTTHQYNTTCYIEPVKYMPKQDTSYRVGDDAYYSDFSKELCKDNQVKEKEIVPVSKVTKIKAYAIKTNDIYSFGLLDFVFYSHPMQQALKKHSKQ